MRASTRQPAAQPLTDLADLERAYCSAATQEEASVLEQALKDRCGLDHFHFLNTALQFVSTRQASTEFEEVSRTRDFFARHAALDLSAFQLRGCRTIEEMETTLGLHRRIAGGDLKRFYQDSVHVLDLGAYAVHARKGIWEAIGGASLHLLDGNSELVKVGGYFRWKHCRPETTIVSIQGAQGTRAAQEKARQSLGVHPGNALLLLYLQMSRVFGQRKVRIRSRASGEYNYQEEDSGFYRIPRNYFRLAVNPETGLYEFDARKRDRILDKFARKHGILADAFAFLESYLSLLDSNAGGYGHAT